MEAWTGIEIVHKSGSRTLLISRSPFLGHQEYVCGMPSIGVWCVQRVQATPERHLF